MMRMFRCVCGWQYVIGNRRVFGPIWEGGNATSARLMSEEQWEDNYSDCASNYYEIRQRPHGEKLACP